MCLFPRDETAAMYPGEPPLDNTSTVDFDAPDVGRFPEFATARGQWAVLQPGEGKCELRNEFRGYLPAATPPPDFSCHRRPNQHCIYHRAGGTTFVRSRPVSVCPSGGVGRGRAALRQPLREEVGLREEIERAEKLRNSRGASRYPLPPLQLFEGPPRVVASSWSPVETESAE